MNESLHTQILAAPAGTRRALVLALNLQLADLLDLGLQAKHAHWNVRGPNFVALHAHFDSMAANLATLADDVAERVAGLGSQALGTAQSIARGSRLEAFPIDAAEGTTVVRVLATGCARAAESARAGLSAAEETGDAVSGDVFLQVTRALDKMRWQLEAQSHPAR